MKPVVWVYDKERATSQQSRSSGILTRSDTNRIVRMLLDLESEGLYYRCSKNKGADLVSCVVDLCLVLAFERSKFSQDAAQIQPTEAIYLDAQNLGFTY